MKLGIFAKTFSGDEPQAVLNAVRDAGYECVQFNWACAGLPSMPDKIDPEHIANTQAALQANALSAVALSGTFNMIHPDPQVRNTGLRRLSVVFDSAAALGIPMVTLCTGSRNPDDQWQAHPDNDLPAAWQDMAAIMEQALDMAQRSGVCLGVEPELGNTVNSIAKAKRLMEQFDTPGLRIVLDPANLFETASDDVRRDIIEDAINQLAPYISLCHAKDRYADGRFCAAGDGVIDYPHYLASLKAIGFDGPLVTHGLNAEDAPRVASYLASVIAAPS